MRARIFGSFERFVLFFAFMISHSDIAILVSCDISFLVVAIRLQHPSLVGKENGGFEVFVLLFYNTVLLILLYAREV